MNVVCVKWGDKYDATYVNRLYSMVCRNMPVDFTFYCYTDDPQHIHKDVKCIPITSNLTGWWPKIDLLQIFTEGDTILFDLDVIILNPLDRLCSIKTRTLSVLYAQWKEGFVRPSPKERFSTLYNSSIMKWSGSQGLEVYDYFQKHKDMILFKYTGIDRFLFNEPVHVDVLSTSIAYSYWKGVRYLKDTTAEKLRPDYEVCILNHGNKQHELKTWITDYWK